MVARIIIIIIVVIVVIIVIIVIIVIFRVIVVVKVIAAVIVTRNKVKSAVASGLIQLIFRAEQASFLDETLSCFG